VERYLELLGLTGRLRATKIEVTISPKRLRTIRRYKRLRTIRRRLSFYRDT
jgi:hypothetical protein